MNKYRFDAERHEYWNGHIKLLSVTQILGYCGYDSKFYKDTGKKERGTYAHQTIEFSEKGTLDRGALDPVLSQYLSLYESKKAELGFTVLETELQLYSKMYPVAGTLDLLSIMNTKKTVIDIKTGQPNPKKDVLQTAGYMMLYNELHKKDPVEQRLMLYIDVDNNSIRHELLTNDAGDIDVFRACIKLAFYKI